MNHGEDRMGEDSWGEPLEASEEVEESPTDSQIRRSRQERPRSVEPVNPNEAPETPSHSLHKSKQAHSGNKQREAGRAEDVSMADDIPEDELQRPNPHFKP